MDRLKDPKFWTVFLGLLVSLGILELSEVEQAELIEAILIVVGATGLVIAWAVEKFGEDQAAAAVMTRGSERNILVDFIERQDAMQAKAHAAAFDAVDLTARVQRLEDRVDRIDTVQRNDRDNLHG